MGLEAKCTVEWLATKRTVALHLDSRHLDVRLKPALRIAFDAIRSTQLEAGRLVLELPEGRMVLHLGADAAAKWAKKIREPKSRLDKLGIKPGMRVCLLEVNDASFERELSAAGVTASVRIEQGATTVILFTPDTTALAQLTSIKKALTPNGAVWVLRAKGKTAAVSEDAVRGAAKRAGLVDVKILAFSEALSALKLVIPVAKRSVSGQR
jgi:hypothetical protein